MRDQRSILVYAKCPICKDDQPVLKYNGRFDFHAYQDMDEMCSGAMSEAKLTPQDKRYAGIKEFVDTVVTTNETLVILVHKRDMIVMLSELAKMGRSKRWTTAIGKWMVEILNAETSLSLRYWVLQGSVYAGHAA